MTKAFKFALLSFVCSTFSFCTKDKINPNYSGKATATVNGVYWEAKVRAVFLPRYPGNVFMSFDAFDESDILRQTLVLNNISPLMDSTFLIENPVHDSTNIILNSNPSSSFYKSNDDLLLEVYNVLESHSRWIIIDRYNSATNEISGRFELSLVRDTSWSNSPPDTLTYVKGTFFGIVSN